MPFFAIAIIPGGNILRTIGEIKTLYFRSGNAGLAVGLPDGIYLGFYSGPSGDAKIQKRFQDTAKVVFSTLPEKLDFSRTVVEDGCGFIVPALPLDRTAAACDKIAASLGFSPAEVRPFRPGMGFFIGKDVTLTPFEAFSVRHVDLVCLRIDKVDEGWHSLAWKVIARSPRRIGMHRVQRHKGLEE